MLVIVFCSIRPNKKMQLDVDVRPPANIMTFRLGLTHVTFDLHPCDLGAVGLGILIIVQEFLSSHRRTDRQTESDAYEPTVQCAQVGSKTMFPFLESWAGKENKIFIPAGLRSITSLSTDICRK